MSQPFLGEIRMFGGNFAPRGWLFCDGQALDVATNDVLFTLIGTTYGGDGVTTFNLPDLRGRIPVHMVDTNALGQVMGAEVVTLTHAQVPAHAHALVATTAIATATTPAGNVLAQGSVAGVQIFVPAPAAGPGSSPLAMTPAGGSQPHTNMMPFQCISFIIAVEGVFPPQG